MPVRCWSRNCARSDGKLTALSAELRPRDVTLNSNILRVLSAAHDDAEYRQLHAELLKTRGTLPDGAIPCDIHGWSTDRDPNGLNVRAGPSTKAKVLGTLPPPYKFKSKGENVPDGGWLTEFSIIGFKDGWFLIEGATPPGKEYEDESSLSAQSSKALRRPRLGRGQQGRRAICQWRHADGRTVPGAACGRAMDTGQRRRWQRDQRRRRPQARSRLQRLRRWWKATTACAAGGDGYARAR